MLSLDLDNLTTYEKKDPQEMREHISRLPEQCADAWRMIQTIDFPETHKAPRSVVVLGMGGSAIGGALLAGLVADTCSAPIISVNSYDLPAHVGADALVIASSHSGNTEETLSALAQAEERGARIMAVTTDGSLAQQAEDKGWPLIQFAYASQPRAAMGYSFTLLLGLAWRLELLRNYETDVKEACEIMEKWQEELSPDVPTDTNPAKQMAWHLIDRAPVIYGAGFLAAVARRWKGQFNENSKNWAVWEELPELNHNAVVGYGFPDSVREHVAVIMLRSSHDHPRIKARWDATLSLLKREAISTHIIDGQGHGKLAHMLSLIHFGDYTSFYLAMLNRTDPTPVDAIDHLKKQLAQV
jgi:glucose/mannose-6-phosphate isomerase